MTPAVAVCALTLMLMAMGCYVAPPPDGIDDSPELGERQQRAVEALGMRGVKRAGYQPFVCAESDSVFTSEGFTATSASGERVRGMVCCGLVLKGCTVRF